MAKTVLEKLGFKPGVNGIIISAPVELKASLSMQHEQGSPPGIILCFVRKAADVRTSVDIVIAQYQRGNRLWFAYPKRSSGIKTDLTRDDGWSVLPEKDLLPVTQIAIDETWSALRFRYRDEISELTRKTDIPGMQGKARKARSKRNAARIINHIRG